jgi:26S proteasome regulatory subunit (ATPase 3-interacting protein)
MELLDNKIEQLQEHLSSLKGHAKKARAELITFCVTPLAPDLRRRINELEQEKERIIAFLTQAQGTSTVHMAARDKADTEREWKRWQKRVKIRNRICHDLWRRCLEVVPEDKNQEELWV